MVRISGRGIWSLKRIILHWLDEPVPPLEHDPKSLTHLVFDGTYFKRTDCFLLLMDARSDRVIGYRYRKKESYATTYDIFAEAAQSGVIPLTITTDGNSSVIRAIRAIWPETTVQRCLVHIQRQGLSWLRRKPKSIEAIQLRRLFLRISQIETEFDRDQFLLAFLAWERCYGARVEALPASDKVYGDLQRARSLLLHAWPDMFHYLNDDRIAPTTNRIEGYFSDLKGRYKQHRGLSKYSRPKYLFWYVYLKNRRLKNNTLPT